MFSAERGSFFNYGNKSESKSFTASEAVRLQQGESQMSRVDKVTEALKQEISNIIQRDLEDPRIGFITITRVEMTADLRYAKVFFSVLGSEEDYNKTKEALDSALGLIRKIVTQRVRLKFAPEIVFKEDRSSEYSIKIQAVLDEIKEQDEHRKSNRRNKKT